MKKLLLTRKTDKQIINMLTAKNLEMIIDMDSMVSLLQDMKNTNKALLAKCELLEESLEEI